MKKALCVLASAACLCGLLSGCSGGNKEKVVIYSSAEDFRNEHLQTRLEEQFPDYEIVVEYQSTGSNAARLKAEGTSTECDIIFDLETGYMEQLKDMLASLDDYDFSNYLPELVPEEKKYAPLYRYSGAVIVNPELLQEKGLAAPTSFEDLLDPKYKGLISMPNPKASSTGYMFLKARVNSMGEEEAFAYFDALYPNVLSFTSSGSGPVNALVQKEAAIGLGMTFQAVNEINKGVDLDLLYFEGPAPYPSGAPYSPGGTAVIDGKLERPAVKAVFDYIYNTLILEDKQLFMPEAIYKDQNTPIENYPTNIVYADMTGGSDFAEKDRLLSKWKY